MEHWKMIIEFIEKFGVPVSLTILFIVWGNGRERRMEEKINSLDHYIQTSMISALQMATAALETSTRSIKDFAGALSDLKEAVEEQQKVLLRVEEGIRNRPCMLQLDENKKRNLP